jgi:hypothetical protein
VADLHTNLAVSLVATAPSPATSGTSLVVTAGEGTQFASVPCNAVIWPAGSVPTKANAEIVRITARSTDTLTITRAQEGSTARTVVVGDQIAIAITAKTLTDIEDVINGVTEPGDHGYLSWNFDPIICQSTSTVLGANGTCYVQKLRIDRPTSVTNINTWVLTAGATLTASQCLAGLYDGSKNLVAVTGDQSATWNSTGHKTMALTGGPFTLQPGYYYVVLMANGTTRPAFLRATGNAHNANLAAASSRWASADTGRTTTLPATLGAFTATANPYWVALS